ncbi:MAG: hypothetical protein HDR17_04235 [Lachnospiraceae bacterium]|nr:hypothetical protein [Lachnospiraceae bacterium]
MQNDYKIRLCDGIFRQFANFCDEECDSMPWCPVCKSEYREGIERCAECKVELVDQLEDEKEQSAEAVQQDYGYPIEESAANSNVLEGYVAFGDDHETTEKDSIPDPPPIYHAYQNSAAKAEDNRSSAYTLLFVGIVGFILVLLVFMGVIPIYRSSGTTKYLVCGVMGALFVLFIVFGAVSMRNSKILFIKAKSEDSLLSEMTKWCEEHLSAQQIDDGLFVAEAGENIPDEQKYFKRTDKMKSIINDKFMNLDEALLEHFVDEYYQELFENQ